MFQLDNKFLQDLGLDQLPPEEKQAFLDMIYNQLELRVGTRLSDGLTDEQLAEFESFVDRDNEKVQAWVGTHAPEYLSDPAYQQLRSKAPETVDANALLAEYASLKWLAMNRPDYRDVVQQVLGELKAEISTNREQILGDQAAA